MTTTQTNLNKTIYEEKIRQYEQTHKELEQYKDSILLQHNFFENKESMYAIAFDNYVIQVYELKKTVEDKKMAYELGKLLDQDGFIAKKEVEDAKIALELAENDLKKLELSTLNAVEKQIEEVTKAKQAAEQEQSKLIVDYELLEISNEHRQLALRKYKTDLLVSLYDQIEQLNMSYQSRARELEGIELSIKDCTIIAPISGTLHITQEVSRGDLMSAGADVATIIPLNDSIYKVEIFMPNSEIAGIQTGDFIKYRFDALPYKEYGQLAGEVHKISVDARVSEAEGISGYIIEGSIPNETVYSYKDEPAQIKVGMTCEAHIVTEQKKILFYLLEKINLMD
jgi:HlyD family secretion protein